MNQSKLLLFSLLLLSALLTTAQQRLDLSKIKSFTLSLPATAASSSDRFTVVDKRFDTAKIGFSGDASGFKAIQLKSGTTDALHRYLNGNYTGHENLLLVIRTLWLHQLKAGELKEAGEEDEKHNISRCVVLFDVYAKENGICRALVRIDTTYETDLYLRSVGSELIAEALDNTLAKIKALNIAEATAKRTPVKESELMLMYDRKKDLPRLQNNVLRRGIYRSFSDFVQNKPAEQDFEIEQDELGDYLYLVENGQPELFTDFWGFCDGKAHFIRLGTNFFRLEKDGNTFSLIGCLQPVHNAQPRSRNRVTRYAIFGVFAELHRTKLVNLLRPIQLNMENGKAF